MPTNSVFGGVSHMQCQSNALCSWSIRFVVRLLSASPFHKYINTRLIHPTHTYAQLISLLTFSAVVVTIVYGQGKLLYDFSTILWLVLHTSLSIFFLPPPVSPWYASSFRFVSSHHCFCWIVSCCRAQHFSPTLHMELCLFVPRIGIVHICAMQNSPNMRVVKSFNDFMLLSFSVRLRALHVYETDKRAIYYTFHILRVRMWV